MKLHRRLFACVLFLLLSPMSANATLITYTGNPFTTTGHYLTAEVEISGTASGVYSRDNLGLESYLLKLFDSNDNFLTSISSADSTPFNDYVRVDSEGMLDSWVLYAYSLSPYIFMSTAFAEVPAISNCYCGTFDRAAYYFSPSTLLNQHTAAAPPSAWTVTAVPEPGTLALLAAGIGFMYRRKTVVGRV